MSKVIRTFVAVHLLPTIELTNFYRELRRSLGGERISWVSESNFHLTLRFIGDTPIAEISTLVNELEYAISGCKSFSLSLGGLDYFSVRKEPRVLFLKLEGGSSLDKLARDVEQAVCGSGFGASPKSFRPHLTLGRIRVLRDKSRFFSLVNQFADIYMGAQKVEEVILYRSILRPDGAVYKPLRVFPLFPG